MRIQCLAGTALRGIDPCEERLWQRYAGCQVRGSLQRRDQAVFSCPNPESSRRVGRYGTRRAQTCSQVVGALHGLDGSDAEQWYQRLIHAVQAAVDAAIAATDDRIFMAEDSARHGISVEVRAPGHGDTRTEFAVVRVIHPTRPVSNVMHQGKAERGIVDLAD